MLRSKLDESTYLRNQIVLVIILPIVVLTMSFAAIFIYQGQVDRRAVESRLGTKLQDTTNSQRLIIIEEILLNRVEALKLRQKIMFDNMISEYPSAKICFKWDLPPAHQIFNNENLICNVESDPLGMKHDEPVPIELPDFSSFGTLQIFYSIPFSFFDYLPPHLLGLLAGILLLAGAFAWFMATLLNLRIVGPLLGKIAEQTQYKAVAQTTQMLAHDIRAPLSQLQVFLNMISSIDDAQAIRKYSQSMLPEVERKRTKIEAMLRDLVQIGENTRAEEKTWVPLSKLISESLTEVFGSFNHHKISLAYENLGWDIFGSEVKLQRIFVNLIGNAVRLMHAKGNISVRCSIGRSPDRVVIALSNSGTFVPPENRKEIFEAFYSKREGGTGLGLTIVKKFVQEYGGHIECESDRDIGTTFVFDLPAKQTTDATSLPSDSQAFASALSVRKETADQETATKDRQDDTLARLKATLSERHEPLALAIIDDEEIYGRSLLDQLKSLNLEGVVEAHYFSNPEVAVEAVSNRAFDAAIIDMQLGHAEIDGRVLCTTIRKNTPYAILCIHSNGFAEISNKVLLSLDPNMILPKPMTKSHLLQFLAMARRKPDAGGSTKAKIALIEDHFLFRQVLVDRLASQFDVSEFDSPANFFNATAGDRGAFIRSFDAIITDFIFDDDPLSGGEFATSILAEHQNAVLILSSNIDEAMIKFPDFKLVVDKSPKSADEIASFLKKELGL